jgi:Sec-independent protein translocase protein TatA
VIVEILGIGPLEIFLILILILIIFGPKEVDKAGKTIGKSLNRFIHSDTWKTINQTSQEIKNLPNRLMREAGLEDLEKAAKEKLSQAGNTIHQPTAADSIDGSPAGTVEKSSGSADTHPTDPPEQTTSE